MSSPCAWAWTPDVFVSFGNDDGGTPGFKQALFNKLKQSGIGFRRTEDNDAEAICEARFALVLLSTKYADSSKCLDELVEILNRRGESGYPSLVVIPIFLDQVPNIGKNLVGDKRENKWKWALTEVRQIAGYYKLTAGTDSDKREKLIRTIIERLVNEMQSLYSNKVFGPFGGEGEMYRPFGKIDGINAFDKFIKSINFKVQRRISNRRQAQLEDPWKKEERITHFSGYLGKATVGGSRERIVIESLVFRTNEGTILETIHGDNRYAGNREDFSVPSVAGEFIEFFGGKTKEGRLTSIGARVKLTRAEPPSKRDDGNAHTAVRRIGAYSIGPFGGGKAWVAKKHKGVKEIYLSLKGDNCYIKFVYDVDGTNRCEVTHPEGVSPKINENEKISLTYSGEYFTSISGYTRDDGSIQALTFYTNRKCYEYGNTNGGKYFGYPSTGTNKIVGFHGTWGKTLNSIGAYVKPIFPDPPTEPSGPLPVRSNPDSWNDGQLSHVIGYRVTDGKGHKKIESITFMYEYNGSLVEGSRHGGGDPSLGRWTMLNFPEERLTSLSGYSRKEGPTTIIHNLKLTTTSTTRTFLTYAQRDKRELRGGIYFKIPKEPDEDTGRRISGFFGKAGECLNYIGAYVGHY